MRVLEKYRIDKDNHERTYFIRIDPEDLSITIKEIIDELFNKSWISQFDKQYVRCSFELRAKDTAEYLANKLCLDDNDNVTSDTGEYVVSELARRTLVKELNYLDIPLAELFKEQKSGNPGFDFYSGTLDKLIVFGEAKYVAAQNAYGKGMEQVDRFIREKQDISDLNDIDDFFMEEHMDNAINGRKAYAIAFSSKGTPSETIIKGILNNFHYAQLQNQEEIIYVAVNL